VENGIVSQITFYVSYQQSNGSWVWAGTQVFERFGNEDRCTNLGIRRHPEYAVAARRIKKRPNEIQINAGVTVRANAEEYRHAQELNLSCVNSMRECSLSDLMPLAYSDWVEDQKWTDQHREELTKAKSECKQQLASGLIAKQRWVTGLGDD
jgi:hypothetical protein